MRIIASTFLGLLVSALVPGALAATTSTTTARTDEVDKDFEVHVLRGGHRRRAVGTSSSFLSPADAAATSTTLTDAKEGLLEDALIELSKNAMKHKGLGVFERLLAEQAETIKQALTTPFHLDEEGGDDTNMLPLDINDLVGAMQDYEELQECLSYPWPQTTLLQCLFYFYTGKSTCKDRCEIIDEVDMEFCFCVCDLCEGEECDICEEDRR